jgi:hypothetical protein
METDSQLKIILNKPSTIRFKLGVDGIQSANVDRIKFFLMCDSFELCFDPEKIMVPNYTDDKNGINNTEYFSGDYEVEFNNVSTVLTPKTYEYRIEAVVHGFHFVVDNGEVIVIEDILPKIEDLKNDPEISLGEDKQPDEKTVKAESVINKTKEEVKTEAVVKSNSSTTFKPPIIDLKKILKEESTTSKKHTMSDKEKKLLELMSSEQRARILAKKYK